MVDRGKGEVLGGGRRLWRTLCRCRGVLVASVGDFVGGYAVCGVGGGGAAFAAGGGFARWERPAASRAAVSASSGEAPYSSSEVVVKVDGRW